ncbi:MAG: hypothetical protein E7214_13730 [Clostridium sp.]|nr:hypothetical protein [Clostridium sp.]
MKKIVLVILLILSINLVSCTLGFTGKESKSKIESVQNTLGNEEIEEENKYEFNTSLENGHFIRKITFNGQENKEEIYNKSSLDKFVDDTNKGNKSELVSIDYLYQDKRYTVNKLRKLKFDGNKIIEKFYDTVSDRNKFALTDTVEYSKINVRDDGENLIYEFYLYDKDNIDIVSFNKNEVTN